MRKIAVALLFGMVSLSGAAQQPPRQIDVPGNPLIADGSVYSADPAPLVADGKFYILSGRDEAEPQVNDFVMREWQLFATKDPGSRGWTHMLGHMKPDTIFKWAEAGGAYAGQIVKGPDGRYYLYAPVRERAVVEGDKFGIGVAVADRPEGPWRDAHPAGPIVSRRTPTAAEMVNIDPTVLLDDDGRVYMYWGTFGEMRAVELDRDMTTLKSRPIEVPMRGFFEAPWLMKRKGTYYLLYAGNEWKAGEKPPECTPAFYHACTAYASAPSPMGPWTYRGLVLKPVSSTTSHTGAVEFDGQWWLAYHTADAVNGGHFRRSVAVDRLEWDESQTPPAMKLVVPTRRSAGPQAPQRNIASAATVTASNEPIPGQYYIEAVRDGKAQSAPLPPEMWANWTGRNDRPAEWLQYSWSSPQTLSGTRVWFWGDQPSGSDEGVAPPKSWRLDYWDGARWKPVVARGKYGTALNEWIAVEFEPIVTRCLRLSMSASGKSGKFAGLGVEEWQALAATPQLVQTEQAAKPCPDRP